jgi:hypothetical protein
MASCAVPPPQISLFRSMLALNPGLCAVVCIGDAQTTQLGLINLLLFVFSWRTRLTGSCRPRLLGFQAHTRPRLPSLDYEQQCCGSMKFWYGSGSADPYLLLMDPDPVIFASDLQDSN